MVTEREDEQASIGCTEFICRYCGVELFPRVFEFEDDSGNTETLHGIFDHCTTLDNQMIYPTLKEAIEAFNG